MRFIAFDTETTGTVPGVDALVEIGAVRFNNGIVDAVFSTLIDPKRPIPPAASKVNGITSDMLVGKPTIDKLLEPFAEFCADDPIVAHNASFDAQFLIADMKKHQFSGPRGVIIDTLPIARKVVPGLANYKLGTLVKHFNIPSTDFHRAEEDATYCGRVFLGLCKIISGKEGHIPIENLISLTGKPEFRFPKIERVPRQMEFNFDY